MSALSSQSISNIGALIILLHPVAGASKTVLGALRTHLFSDNAITQVVFPKTILEKAHHEAKSQGRAIQYIVATTLLKYYQITYRIVKCNKRLPSYEWTRDYTFVYMYCRIVDLHSIGQRLDDNMAVSLNELLDLARLTDSLGGCCLNGANIKRNSEVLQDALSHHMRSEGMRQFLRQMFDEIDRRLHDSSRECASMSMSMSVPIYGEQSNPEDYKSHEYTNEPPTVLNEGNHFDADEDDEESDNLGLDPFQTEVKAESTPDEMMDDTKMTQGIGSIDDLESSESELDPFMTDNSQKQKPAVPKRKPGPVPSNLNLNLNSNPKPNANPPMRPYGQTIPNVSPPVAVRPNNPGASMPMHKAQAAPSSVMSDPIPPQAPVPRVEEPGDACFDPIYDSGSDNDSDDLNPFATSPNQFGNKPKKKAAPQEYERKQEREFKVAPETHTQIAKQARIVPSAQASNQSFHRESMNNAFNIGGGHIQMMAAQRTVHQSFPGGMQVSHTQIRSAARLSAPIFPPSAQAHPPPSYGGESDSDSDMPAKPKESGLRYRMENILPSFGSAVHFINGREVPEDMTPEAIKYRENNPPPPPGYLCGAGRTMDTWKEEVRRAGYGNSNQRAIAPPSHSAQNQRRVMPQKQALPPAASGGKWYWLDYTKDCLRPCDEGIQVYLTQQYESRCNAPGPHAQFKLGTTTYNVHFLYKEQQHRRGIQIRCDENGQQLENFQRGIIFGRPDSNHTLHGFQCKQ